MSAPGMMPARKRAAIETVPVTWAKTIMAIEGGMIGPIVAEQRTIAVAKRRV